ncbi:MAG: T9SS type A sorting domain-containing protein [Taibaiella sp.]|nr:T9SS type A sorting domain-containing protein [Taibaiella sp.]
MKKGLYLLLCIVFLLTFFIPVHSQVISTVAGTGTAGFSGDGGPATSAQLDTATCIALDLAGNLYINVQRSNRVRKVDVSGTITTIAGNGTLGFSGDGGPATAASLSGNWGMAADAFGNIYISDQGNHRIRKVSSTGIITTIAGTGTSGFSGDGGPATAAKMNAPLGIAVDPSGNVYFSDSYNFCVRKVNTSGIITTVAGIPGVSGFGGDGGPATSARLRYIWGLALDAAGNLYLCDAPNERVRRVDAGGIITTIAGTGSAGYDLDNVAATTAKLNKPLNVFVAGDGKIYIADYANNRIRRIDNAGIITTIAGTGTGGYNGDGIPATSAYLQHPISAVADADDNVFLSDMLNSRIRKVATVLSFIGGDDEQITVCENSTANPINTQLAVRDVNVGMTDTWSLHTAPSHGTAYVSYSAVSGGGVITPVGLTYTPNPGFSGLDTFKVEVSNAIASDIISIFVKVDPALTVGPISGASSICVGDTTTLTDPTPGGLWSSATGRIQLFPASLYCTAKGLSAGLDTVIYRVVNACGTSLATKAMTVNPLPDPGTISGPEAFCIGAITPFYTDVTGGTWSTSNLNATVESVTADHCDVKGIYKGAVTIIHTVFNSWCPAVAIKQVVVDTFPQAGFISGPEKVCVGEEVILIDTVSAGAWSGTPFLVQVDMGTVKGVLAGSTLISYSVSNSCGTDVATHALGVAPLPERPSIYMFRGMLSTAPGYTSYQWTLDGLPIGGAVNDSLLAENTGTYQVSVTNEFGCRQLSDTFAHTGCTADDMILYPNPTSEFVHIAWCRLVNIRIITADGKEVMTAEEVREADLSMLPPGVYFLSLFDKGRKVRTERVVRLP